MSIYIIDTETTGFKNPQIIEFAYIKLPESVSDFLNTSSENCDKHLERFKPSIPIDTTASKIHGIYAHHLRNCRSTTELKLPAMSHMICHNVSFDYRVLGKPAVKTICTLKLARQIFKEPRPRNYKQSTLMEYLYPNDYQSKIKGVHAALADCENTFLLLQELIKKLPKIKSWEDLVILSI